MPERGAGESKWHDRLSIQLKNANDAVSVGLKAGEQNGGFHNSLIGFISAQKAGDIDG